MAERDLIDELLQAKVKSKLFGGDHAPRLGRLVILDRLGSGGMGTVLSAYDPQLDRKVALKILRDPGAAGARVLSEARMLGKLNHPNVVAVHDVTELDGAVAIVMELAPGEPLRAWVGKTHSVDEVTRVMRQVAEGLSAVHAAGVVHRDVKPDNIVIGPDRARLVDFGVADGVGGGGLGGTAGYVAPEVLAGAPPSAASDQYAFAVTLHEVLYGKRPATDGPVAPDASVPRWLEQATQRALSPDPAARFSSMAALAHELGRDRVRRRQRVALGAVALMGLTAAVTFGYQRGQRRDACGGGRARIAASGSPASIERLRTSLGDAPWAKKTADDFVALTESWEQSYRRICEAGASPESLLALRMRCLDRSLLRMNALGAQLGAPLGGEARESLSGAVAAFPRPERCESLTDASELALPDDPSTRRELEHAERELDRAWALYSLGRYADARQTSAALEERTRQLAVPHFRAALLLLLGQSEARLGLPSGRSRLQAALLEAGTANAAQLELEIWTRLLKTALFDGNPAHVVEWAPFARVAAARAGSPGAELDAIEGEARRDRGDLDGARQLLERALTAGGPLRGDQHALIEMNLGSIELQTGHPERAAAAFSRALELATRALGAEHPSLGLYYDKQAVAARERGRIGEALRLHERALELRRRVFGEGDRAVATALLRRAETHIEAGSLAAAEADLASARQIRVRLYGDPHRRLGEIDVARGDAAAARGERERALALYRGASAVDPSLDVASRLAELGEPVDPAKAAAAWSGWQTRGEGASARMSNDVAELERRRGHGDNARRAHAAALETLTDEPCRQRLRALTGLARTASGQSARAWAEAALALASRLPELDASAKSELERIARR